MNLQTELIAGIGINMGIPKKALKESQLTYQTAGSVIDGSHQTFRVTFLEDGTTKSAFLKKISPAHHYPELLAKISVATSVFKRLFQGKSSAEERLVFDDRDQLIGTLSLTIDGFKPFNYHNESIKPGEKEQVVPSTQSLIDKNIIGTLLGRWFLDDDDAHPHNIGFAGDTAADIDFDMFWYWFIIHMKGARPIIGVPKTRVSLTTSDWVAFPATKEAKHYHWPTYRNPGEVTLPTGVGALLPKAYADPLQFQALAGNKLAQEQKLAASLKILLTYQPQMVRARLVELFGEMPLNYTSLEARLKYEEAFPEWCNEKTNVAPFVDFMMKLYQTHYDNLYRIVVFFMGCDDNGYGLSLPETCNALYLKPSFYKNVVAWATEQNDTEYRHAEPAVKYDINELRKRYHQIWRDTFTPHLRDLLHASYNLTVRVLHEASTFIDVKHQITDTKECSDATLTRAVQLFGTLPEITRSNVETWISVSEGSALREALLSLVDFTNELTQIVHRYYEKDCACLTEEDNQYFVHGIDTLYRKYNLCIRTSLAHSTTFAQEFSRIAASLKQLSTQAEYQVHLTTTDEQMKDMPVSSIPKNLPLLTSPQVVAQFADALFLWVKGRSPQEFTRLLTEIIDKTYTPAISILSWRKRTDSVKAYLVLSEREESNDNRLAYIFSSGTVDGALNTTLLEALAAYVAQAHYLPSLNQSLKLKQFSAETSKLLPQIVLFARSDRRFSHFYSIEGVRAFFDDLFFWTNSISKTQLTGIINAALDAYGKGSWFGGGRQNEVREYCKTHTGGQLLGMILKQGAETSSLNKILFHKIIATMQSQSQNLGPLKNNKGVRLIMSYNEQDPLHTGFYLGELKVHAARFASQQEIPPPAMSQKAGV